MKYVSTISLPPPHAYTLVWPFFFFLSYLCIKVLESKKILRLKKWEKWALPFWIGHINKCRQSKIESKTAAVPIIYYVYKIPFCWYIWTLQSWETVDHSISTMVYVSWWSWISFRVRSSSTSLLILVFAILSPVPNVWRSTLCVALCRNH